MRMIIKEIDISGEKFRRYLVNTRHTSLISDAASLDYLTF